MIEVDIENKVIWISKGVKPDALMSFLKTIKADNSWEIRGKTDSIYTTYPTYDNPTSPPYNPRRYVTGTGTGTDPIDYVWDDSSCKNEKI